MRTWLVMRLVKWENLVGNITPFLQGVPMGRPDDGSFGFVPVYDDHAKAVEASDGGRYAIAEVVADDGLPRERCPRCLTVQINPPPQLQHPDEWGYISDGSRVCRDCYDDHTKDMPGAAQMRAERERRRALHKDS